MLNLFACSPDPQTSDRLHSEPITRLASLRNALRVVDDFGGGPAPDSDGGDCDDHISVRWVSADETARRCFDRRSAELVSVATAGLEAVSFRREQGLDASVTALRIVADQLRGGLTDLERVLSR